MAKKNKRQRIKLIANPGAGSVLGNYSLIEQARSFLTDSGFKVDLVLVKPVKKSVPIVQKAVKDGYDIIVGMGGDHTFDALIRGVKDSKVKLGLIPAGTANDIAKALGIPKDVKGACDMIAAGHLRKLDLGWVRTKKTKKFYFFMVTAVGLIATVYPMVEEVPQGNLSGIPDAIKSVLHFESSPRMVLTLDGGQKVKVESMLATIANTPIVGLKNLIAPDAMMDDGLLDIAVYPNYSKAELLAYYARTTNEGRPPEHDIQRYQAREIKIKTNPKLDIAAEGVIVGKGKATIGVLRHGLRVFAPEMGMDVKLQLDKAAG